VGDGRAGGRERDAPAGALGAAPDRPRGRCTAAVAERRAQSREPCEAANADRLAGKVAADTALRQEQVEDDQATLVVRLRSVCADFVTIGPKGPVRRPRGAAARAASASGCRPPGA